jgi:hypothetical protein
MDCINALLVLAKHQPQLLARPIHIRVCDLDRKGPAFGANAIAALSGSGSPFEGLAITFDATPYDWNDTSGLERILETIPKSAIITSSSEGALFEYGSDEAIIANLRILHGNAKLVVGSVTSNQPIRCKQIKATRFNLTPRGLEGFRPLTERAGYSIDRAEITPLSDHVLLRPKGSVSLPI